MIALASGRLPMGGATFSSPFPFFTLEGKLQFANVCLYNGAEAKHRPSSSWCMGIGPVPGGDARAPPTARESGQQRT